MTFSLVVGNVEVPLLEVVPHAGEGGIHQSKAGDVHIVVLVRCQVEALHVLRNKSYQNCLELNYKHDMRTNFQSQPMNVSVS